MTVNLPAQWDLPDGILTEFSDKTGRQRIVRDEGHMLISLHWVPTSGQTDRTPVWLWHRPDGAWFSYLPPVSEQLNVDPEQLDPDHLTLRSALDAYDRREDELELELEQCTNAIEYLDVLQEVATGQHAIRNLHETLETVPVDELGGQVDSLLSLRDYAYEIRRSYDFLEDFSRNRLEIHRAQQAEEANYKTSQLSLIAAFTLPLTALASVFSMAPENGQILTDPFFWLILALGSVWGWGLWMRLRS